MLSALLLRVESFRSLFYSIPWASTDARPSGTYHGSARNPECPLHPNLSKDTHNHPRSRYVVLHLASQWLFQEPTTRVLAFRTARRPSQDPPPDHHDHHVVIEGKAFVSSEGETQKIDLPGAKIGKISKLYGDANPAYERALQSHVQHAKLHHYPLFIPRQKLLA